MVVPAIVRATATALTGKKVTPDQIQILKVFFRKAHEEGFRDLNLSDAIFRAKEALDNQTPGEFAWLKKWIGKILNEIENQKTAP